MNKVLSILTVFSILFMILCFTGCHSHKIDTTDVSSEEGLQESSEVLCGGWSLNAAKECKLPDDVNNTLNNALKEYAGMALMPVAYLGSQVVSGTNYAILCKATSTTNPPVTEYKIVELYSDLEGGSRINQLCDFSFMNLEESELTQPEENLSGGWAIAEEKAILSDEDIAPLNAALEEYTGATFEPIALLGTQVVAGTNYAYLCKATAVTANPVTSLAVVKVYKDLEGKCEILSVSGIQIASFIK